MGKVCKEKEMKRVLCRCFFCRLRPFKDIRGLIVRACGKTESVIDTPQKLCVPLLMVQAAHMRNPRLFLSVHYKFILDFCYEPINDRLAQSLIKRQLFRDQATFHHALIQGNERFAELLFDSGCPCYVVTVVIEGFAFWYSVKLPKRIPTILSAVWHRGSRPDDKCITLFKRHEKLQVRLKGHEFIAWRQLQPVNMIGIYQAEKDWTRKREKDQQTLQKVAKKQDWFNDFNK